MAADSWASTPATRKSMQGNRSRDTGPELALRRAVHSLGLRYRVATRPIPAVRRTADLVFPRAKVAVFMDGCFWHGCPEHYRAPTANSTYWSDKVERNKKRDTEVDRLLAEYGWHAIRVWEHENPRSAALKIEKLIRSDSSS
ncbi:MAG: very short patch repair endonuclease [Saccharothrix sp.]|nr:very short patch repair endonuclease [Saccharothrix sp.]